MLELCRCPNIYGPDSYTYNFRMTNDIFILINLFLGHFLKTFPINTSNHNNHRLANRNHAIEIFAY